MKSFIALCLLVVAASALPNHHIINGDTADIGEFPWQLALFRRGQFSCGASIVGPNLAITAAHCIGGPSSDYSIKAGTNFREANCARGDCEERVITNATRHPSYIGIGFLGFPNDIATLVWDEPIRESTGKLNIKYIKRTTRTDEVGKKCFISGWGRNGGATLPTSLLKSEIEALTNEECLKTWAIINDGHICLHDLPDKNQGACNGDSGGPFVCEFEPKKFELVGATSWGVGGCNTSYPSVYSRITYFNEWLDTFEDN